MTDEEKEAVEYTKNCLKSICLGFDFDFDINVLDILLNLIEKQQKEIEKKDKQIDLMCEQLVGEYIKKEASEDEEIEKKNKIIDLICECVFKRFKAVLVIEYGIENKEELKERLLQYLERKAENEKR